MLSMYSDPNTDTIKQLSDADLAAQVTTEKQREAFMKELAQAEDWLYEDGAAQSGPVFRYATLTPSIV